jgi:hypothetical protein
VSQAVGLAPQLWRQRRRQAVRAHQQLRADLTTTDPRPLSRWRITGDLEVYHWSAVAILGGGELSGDLNSSS